MVKSRNKKSEAIMKKHIGLFYIFCFLSLAVSVYIMVKSCINNTLTGIIVSFAATLIIFLNILSQFIFKPNMVWTVSKLLIIPEIISTILLFIWKPAPAFLEAVLIIISVLYSYYVFYKNSKKKYKAKTWLRYINVNIALCSILLFPGTVFMLPYVTSIKPIAAIPNHVISLSSECNVLPYDWNSMTLSEKINFVENLVSSEAAILKMNSTPDINITFLPSFLYGDYNRDDDRIQINARLIQENNVEQLVETVCHEMYHRYEYNLVDYYSKNYLNKDELTDNLKEKAEVYAYEFKNYKQSGITSKSYDRYYNQFCECDARTYAEMRVAEYCSNNQQ